MYLQLLFYSASKKSAEDEKEILKKKCDQLRHDLHRAQKSIEKLKSREKELTTRCEMNVY